MRSLLKIALLALISFGFQQAKAQPNPPNVLPGTAGQSVIYQANGYLLGPGVGTNALGQVVTVFTNAAATTNGTIVSISGVTDTNVVGILINNPSNAILAKVILNLAGTGTNLALRGFSGVVPLTIGANSVGSITITNNSGTILLTIDGSGVINTLSNVFASGGFFTNMLSVIGANAGFVINNTSSNGLVFFTGHDLGFGNGNGIIAGGNIAITNGGFQFIGNGGGLTNISVTAVSAADYLIKTNAATGGMTNIVGPVDLPIGTFSVGTNVTSGKTTINGYGNISQQSTLPTILILSNATPVAAVTLDGSTGNANMLGSGFWGATDTATNGFSSLSTVTSMTTSATGCTNSTGMVQIIYVTAATSGKLTDNAGNTEFSGVSIAAFTPIRIQNGGQFTGTGITYAAGAASHAW